MLEDLDHKTLYNKILMHNKSNLHSKQYWCAKLRLNDVYWEGIFSNLFDSKLIPPKISDFNWKVFYGVIPVENRLKQMRKSDEDCKLCNEGLRKYWTPFCEMPKSGKFLGKCSWMYWKITTLPDYHFSWNHCDRINIRWHKFSCHQYDCFYLQVGTLEAEKWMCVWK